jgi:predicted Zn-ribbon and HTH transcriptional regulator
MGRKKTHEEFVKEVYDLTNGEYVVIGKYVNTKTHIIMKHNIENCGHEYFVKPYHFLNGSRCPECFGSKKKTTEQYKQEVYDLVRDEYTVLGEYNGAHKKILMKHNSCEHEWEVDANSFLRGTRCPKCFGNIKKTHEQFCKEIYDLVGDEYEICSNYINTNTPIKMLHNVCGNYINIEPTNFLSSSRCIYCAGVKQKNTNQFKEEIYELEGDNYLLLSEYINNKTKVLIKHNIDNCGYEYHVTPSNFLTGNRCPKCRGYYRTTDEFKEIVKELEGNKYEVLTEYINVNHPITMKHITCGHI